jgi:hypothetical protein
MRGAREAHRLRLRLLGLAPLLLCLGRQSRPNLLVLILPRPRLLSPHPAPDHQARHLRDDTRAPPPSSYCSPYRVSYGSLNPHPLPSPCPPEGEWSLARPAEPRGASANAAPAAPAGGAGSGGAPPRTASRSQG